MVHFVESDEQGANGDAAPVAPVAYLPGATPGMKRRSPIAERSTEATPFTRKLRAVEDAEDAEGDEVVDVGAAAGPSGPTSTDRVERDDDETDENESSGEKDRAEKVLMHRLHGRSLSTKEALEVLRGTELGRDDIEEIIARFTDLHYIDEQKLAEQVLHSHGERKGLGRTGVGAELRRRGVDPDVIAAALEELPDDETERAIDIATKRIGQLERFDETTIKRRLSAFLQRKGYSSDICRTAIAAALESRGGGSTSSSRSPVRFQ
ncbi:RecX family transcriptional regulator [Cryobacterium melibiosiphilum]|uniref:Regulatory protein RecX n=1 Tax=Cryobacterium melibiosiphilum TaxID=995039 RepID=A0A3A5MMN3_9MICO|nr:regulatory protein RecX [Cryobacterium melibiosiphilum]RJT87296.1 RecX family transcriptional regulator [Cryobacterium melibiosiphilum]